MRFKKAVSVTGGRGEKSECLMLTCQVGRELNLSVPLYDLRRLPRLAICHKCPGCVMGLLLGGLLGVIA